MKAAVPLLFLQLLSSLFLPTVITAENITIHEVINEQQYHPIEHELSSPFLSATLKTDISPVSSAVSQQQIDSLSSVLVSFLNRVFDEQQFYDVAIVGVAIFEESLVDIADGNGDSNDNNAGNIIDNKVPSSRNGKRTRKLALNALQAGQFHFNEDEPNTRLQYEDEEDVDDDGSWDEQPWDDETALLLEDETTLLVKDESSNGSTDIGGSGVDGGTYYTLSFATIVSAEHTQHQSLSHTEFQTMLVHVCSKFVDHMVEYVTDIDDIYFENVESVIVSGYEEEEEQEDSKNDAENGSAADGLNSAEEEERKEEESTRLSGAASIVGIAVVVILLLVLSVISSMKLIAFYRRRKRSQQQHKTNNTSIWNTQEITTHANNNLNNATSIKSLSILYSKPHEDDFSFNPLCTDNGYNGKTSFDYDNANESFDNDGHRHREEEIVSFVGKQQLSPLPNATDMIAFPPRQPSSSSSPMAKLKQEHVFAPPGKVGVAIDVVNGQPVVHKVKKGSPLEGLLQKNDLVLAIDDVDTTRMSAADVTSLMVKRMNYGRKITFVRV